MKDERKTKKQLINELVELRQRTAVLETAEVRTNKVHRPAGSDGGSADETLIKVS